MIRSINLNNKSYDERIREAIASIPIYTEDWTNYNPSDPGITIVENLSLFETLQQEKINEMPSSVKANLLKMAGFVPGKGKCAHVLVKAENLTQEITIPKGQSFMAYDIPFEATKAIKVEPGKIKGIFVKKNDEISNISYIADTRSKISAHVFSKKPCDGVELYIITDRLPEPGVELLSYIRVKDDDRRNPLEDSQRDLFGHIEWEYYCDDGFCPMHVKDGTFGFLQSGEVRMRIGDKWPAIFEELDVTGYCIKATLMDECYDVSPQVLDITSFLFELTQMMSKSYCLTGAKSSEISFLSKIENNSFVSVFVKEEKGGSYYKYEPLPEGMQEKGRYYTISDGEDGYTKYCFNKAKFGYGPEKGRACVRVLIYNEEVMRNYKLDRVLGYDNQEIKLPFNHLVSDAFSVLSRRVDEQGEYIYDFVRPGRSGDDNLFYLLNDRDGIMVIKDAGDFIGAQLFMAGCATYSGDKGNIREGNVLKADEPFKGIKFINPSMGHGGSFPENLESVRKRFIDDIDTPYTAVSKKDYERLAMTTPGLIIDKAAAMYNEAESRVYVAVLPGGEGDFPKLSDHYIEKIEDRLSDRRLLITKSSVISCLPVKINVRATVYVKQHFDDSFAQIEKALKELLNYPKSDRKIGSKVRFDEVFHCIESLPCVEYVHSLNIRAQRSGYDMTIQDVDITPIWNGLAVPGAISIDTVSYGG